MTDFTSNFWGFYIAVIVLISIIAVALLLRSNSTVRVKKGEKVELMGHTWDGDLAEYNNPLPGWWVALFYLLIAFALGYLLLYPGLVAFGNARHWSSASQHSEEVKQANNQFGPLYDKYLNMPVAEVAKDATAREMGQRLFLTYCMQCHGANAQGAKGFPNLTDNDWLHGGSPEKIKETINKGRQGQMPAFGAAFGEEKVKDVANYVLKISGRKHNDLRAERGAATFQQVCIACHGPEGKGNQDIGAPNLTDKIWLYGGSEQTIIETITNGRINVMPSWQAFLGDAKVQLLTAYVYGLSQNVVAK
ncbi:MAG: cytochrome-c oxidase, cbb3-type subunit III [Formivibrio sp.]|nr:cytochrome-c oxidase, cbb3-type subunit III [Formivibrio sp.]